MRTMDELHGPAQASGATGQEATPANAPLMLPENPFPKPGLSQAVGLVANSAKGLGNAGPLMAGIAAHMDHELACAKRDIASLREELKRMTQDYYAEKEKVAVLQEQVKTGGGIRKLQAIFLVVGTGIVSIAADLYKGGLDHIGFLLGATGAALIVLGWFWPIREAK